jgi:hypothetical protein
MEQFQLKKRVNPAVILLGVEKMTPPQAPK